MPKVVDQETVVPAATALPFAPVTVATRVLVYPLAMIELGDGVTATAAGASDTNVTVVVPEPATALAVMVKVPGVRLAMLIAVCPLTFVTDEVDESVPPVVDQVTLTLEPMGLA